jgi:hypothetical protein
MCGGTNQSPIDLDPALGAIGWETDQLSGIWTNAVEASPTWDGHTSK